MTIQEIIERAKTQGTQASPFIRDLIDELMSVHESEALTNLAVKVSNNGTQSSALLYDLILVMGELGYEGDDLDAVKAACAEQGTQSSVFVPQVAEAAEGGAGVELFGFKGGANGSSIQVRVDQQSTTETPLLPNFEYSANGTDWHQMTYRPYRDEEEEIDYYVSDVFSLAADEVLYLRGDNPDGFNIEEPVDNEWWMYVNIHVLGAPSVFGDLGTLIEKSGGSNVLIPNKGFTMSIGDLFFSQLPEDRITNAADILSSNWEIWVAILDSELFLITPIRNLYRGCTFPMTDDGENFNFKFGKSFPTVAYIVDPDTLEKTGETIEATAYDMAKSMGNTAGFQKP